MLADGTKSWNANTMKYVDTSSRPGATVYNITDGSYCAITENTENTISCILSGGTENDWDIDDQYRISAGRVCRDQIGTGGDSSLWASPFKDNLPGPTQYLMPTYTWSNMDDGAIKGMAISTISAEQIIENIDYYNHNTSFDGTAGVGCGTLANRPTTCTTNVAYWATDQSCTDLTDYVGANSTTPISGTLYKCTSTDTWAEYYTPYTYPHPLRSGDDVVAPAAPASLAVQ